MGLGTARYYFFQHIPEVKEVNGGYFRC